MLKAIEVAGDVAAAGSALAGLILVYLGSVSANYSAIPTEKRGFVRGRYLTRGWFAFGGLALCLASVGSALVGTIVGRSTR